MGANVCTRMCQLSRFYWHIHFLFKLIPGCSRFSKLWLNQLGNFVPSITYKSGLVNQTEQNQRNGRVAFPSLVSSRHVEIRSVLDINS